MTAPHSLHLADSLPARRLRSGSLYTGYGGLDLAAAAVLGARLAWCAESDRHAAAVLAALYLTAGWPWCAVRPAVLARHASAGARRSRRHRPQQIRPRQQ